MRYEEFTIEGRNAVIEAFRSGKTIDKKKMTAKHFCMIKAPSCDSENNINDMLVEEEQKNKHIQLM